MNSFAISTRPSTGSLWSSSPGSLKASGCVYQEEKNYTKALEMYQKALNLIVNRNEVLSLKIRIRDCLRQLDKHEECLDCCEAILQYVEECDQFELAVTCKMKGICLQYLSMNYEALDSFKQALEIVKKNRELIAVSHHEDHRLENNKYKQLASDICNNMGNIYRGSMHIETHWITMKRLLKKKLHFG